VRSPDLWCLLLPPPSLPHKGGGVGRWACTHRAPNALEHPPPCGEGWGGGRGLTPAR
jgi:hypothetical protein